MLGSHGRLAVRVLYRDKPTVTQIIRLKGNIREPSTFTPVAEHLAVELSLPVLQQRFVATETRTPDLLTECRLVCKEDKKSIHVGFWSFILLKHRIQFIQQNHHRVTLIDLMRISDVRILTVTDKLNKPFTAKGCATTVDAAGVSGDEFNQMSRDTIGMTL